MGYLTRNRRLTNDQARTIRERLKYGQDVEDHINDFRTHMGIPEDQQISVHLEDGHYDLNTYLIFMVDGQKYNYNPHRGVMLLTLN